MTRIPPVKCFRFLAAFSGLVCYLAGCTAPQARTQITPGSASTTYESDIRRPEHVRTTTLRIKITPAVTPPTAAKPLCSTITVLPAERTK